MKSNALPADLIAIPEAAKILRVHVTSVYRYVMRRQLPAYKVGGRYWLSRGDVLGFVQRTGPGGEGGDPGPRAPVPSHAEAVALLRKEGYTD
jgi:excisionase family DNA binding protein